MNNNQNSAFEQFLSRKSHREELLKRMPGALLQLLPMLPPKQADLANTQIRTGEIISECLTWMLCHSKLSTSPSSHIADFLRRAHMALLTSDEDYDDEDRANDAIVVEYLIEAFQMIDKIEHRLFHYEKQLSRLAEFKDFEGLTFSNTDYEYLIWALSPVQQYHRDELQPAA